MKEDDHFMPEVDTHVSEDVKCFRYVHTYHLKGICRYSYSEIFGSNHLDAKAIRHPHICMYHESTRMPGDKNRTLTIKLVAKMNTTCQHITHLK